MVMTSKKHCYDVFSCIFNKYSPKCNSLNLPGSLTDVYKFNSNVHPNNA